jgi:iron complex outermembrane receptor protein
MTILQRIVLASIAATTPAVAVAAPDTGTPDTSAARVAQNRTVASEGQLDDIVVTARRREESAQTVPVSITALGGQALEERQVRSLGDLTNVAPGIRFVSQGGSGSMNVILRGIGKAPAGDAPNSVITYFGDVPLYFWGSEIPAYDLASVQVLKGPQGTLFGRNSIGGAVIVSPARPTYDVEGYGRASLGNYDYRDLETAVNVPIIADKVALRLAGKLTRRDGYTKNISFKNADLNDQHRDSFRASLLIEPSDNLRNITVADWFRAREHGEGTILQQIFPTGTVRTPALAASFDCHTATAANPVPCVGFQPNRDIDDAFTQQQAIGKRAVATSAPTRLNRDLWGIQNRTELTVGDVEFRNIFGYRNTKIRSRGQSQSTGFGVQNVVPPPPAGTPVSLVDGYTAITIGQLSEEVQAIGKVFDDRVDYIFGAFYINEKPSGVNYGKNNIGGYGSSFSGSYNDRTSKALYGQLGIQIVDGLKLNAGYRHTWDKQDVCIAVTPAAAGFPKLTNSKCKQPGVGVVVPYRRNAPTYTVGLDWQVNDNVFAYVTHRRSFRVGGVNAPIYNTPGTAILAPFQTYAPEKVVDYEVGVKTDWNVSGWRMRFNIDAFRTDYTGVTQSLNVASLIPANDPAFPYNSGSIVINTGSRQFTGGEAEFVVQPTPRLSFSGNTAYIHVEANAPPTPFPAIPAPAVIPLAPKWATNASVRWELPFQPMDGKLVFNADYFYQSKFHVGNATFPSYDVTNARLEWSNIGASGAGLALFVRNIFDKANIVAAGATSRGLGFFSAQYSEPRMYGVELSYKF